MIGGRIVRVEVDDSSGLKETCGGSKDTNKPGAGVTDKCTVLENLLRLKTHRVRSAVESWGTVNSSGPAKIAKSDTPKARLFIKRGVRSE